MVYHDSPSLSSTELQEITVRVTAKLGGRLRGFRLDASEGRLILCGQCSSYHVKQLAQEEVMGQTSRRIERNEIEVGYQGGSHR